MIKEIEYQGKTYEVNTTPETRIEVVGFERVEIAEEHFDLVDFITKELGKTPTRKIRRIVSEDERAEVILACGWKFSTSKKWKSEWDYLYRNSMGSTWGECKVGRV